MNLLVSKLDTTDGEYMQFLSFNTIWIPNNLIDLQFFINLPVTIWAHMVADNGRINLYRRERDEQSNARKSSIAGKGPSRFSL